MRQTIAKYFFLMIALVISTQGNGQVLYPGDVTNNGQVNGIDVIYLGLAFHEEGVPRGGPIIFQSTPFTEWGNTFSNGLDYAYADCNGDGKVDEDDILVIEDFLGETQPTVSSPDIFTNGSPGVDPVLNFMSPFNIIGPGDNMDLSLNLGTESDSILNFYGITFTVNYDPNIINSDDIDFKFPNTTWIDTVLFPPSLPNIEHLEVNDASQGKLHVAITRRDQNPISGWGEIGTIKIVAEEIIVGLNQDTTISIDFSDVKLISHDMSIIPIYQESFPLVITTDTSLAFTTTTNEYVNPPELEIFPNPTYDDQFVTEASDAIHRLTLFDLLGRSIPVQQEVESSNRRRIYLNGNVPTGIYVVSVKTKKGTVNKKIIIP